MSLQLLRSVGTLLLLSYSAFLSSLSHGAFLSSAPSVNCHFNSQEGVQDVLNKNHRTIYQATKNEREEEIRKKIKELRKQGKISNPSSSTTDDNGSSSSITYDYDSPSQKQQPVMGQYADKIQAQLGKRGLAKLMRASGSSSTKWSNIYDSPSSSSSSTPKATKDMTNPIDDDNDFELDDEDEVTILQLVEQKLLEKKQRELEEELAKTENGNFLEPDIDEIANRMESEAIKAKNEFIKKNQNDSGSDISVDVYRPANGWGYFPRPKNISEAYGGGKKVGAAVPSTYENELRKVKMEEDTMEKLRRYREKVGIDVQSEKEHADEIDEALALGQRAMQRGVYSTAVSCFEKVTKYCSTNSKVGGKVFLELAMAYEAVGRTDEAIQVYSTLSSSRNEEVQFNARRLLQGLEAMNFMRNEAKLEAFSRKKVTQTFIDTTGLANIADNFDVKYNTAYIDLERSGSFYRKLTESVVRSVHEAREILLKATDSGEIDRLKIVQALRLINRSFDDALRDEKKRNAPKEEPVAIMNGKPIMSRTNADNSGVSSGVDAFYLGHADQMKENLGGEWKLQLIADNKGDGVQFYNKTNCWQLFEMSSMTYDAYASSGFLTLSQKGHLDLNYENRIITRSDTNSGGSGALFARIFGTNNLFGAAGSISWDQQVMVVDSQLLITRLVSKSKDPSNDLVKDYFSVWRRVSVGYYSVSNFAPAVAPRTAAPVDVATAAPTYVPSYQPNFKSTPLSGSGLGSYLDELKPTSSSAPSGKGLESYLDSVSSKSTLAAIAAPQAAAVFKSATPRERGLVNTTTYLDTVSRPVPLTGHGLTSYLDTVNRPTATLSGPGLITYASAMKTPVTNTPSRVELTSCLDTNSPKVTAAAPKSSGAAPTEFKSAPTSKKGISTYLDTINRPVSQLAGTGFVSYLDDLKGQAPSVSGPGIASYLDGLSSQQAAISSSSSAKNISLVDRLDRIERMVDELGSKYDALKQKTSHFI